MLQINHLNDSHTLLMMRWAGEGSKVLLCLARDINFAVPQVVPARPSALYISYNYGDTFENKTDLIRLPDGRPSVVYKFYTHPKVMSLVSNSSYGKLVDVETLSYSSLIFMSVTKHNL